MLKISHIFTYIVFLLLKSSFTSRICFTYQDLLLCQSSNKFGNLYTALVQLQSIYSISMGNQGNTGHKNDMSYNNQYKYWTERKSVILVEVKVGVYLKLNRDRWCNPHHLPRTLPSDPEDPCSMVGNEVDEKMINIFKWTFGLWIWSF